MAILRSGLLWASRNRWLAEHLPRFPPTRRAVRRFMPGERLEDALDAAAELRDRGIATVVTQLGENIEDREEADAVRRHYDDVFEQVAQRGLDCHVSVKLTQLGIDLETDLAAQHVDALAAHAAEHGNFLWIDIEASEYVERTLEVFRRVRSVHENVGLCLQAYLYRTSADLQALLPLHPAIRLVKGAYKEPASIAYPKRSDVDTAYKRLARTLLEEKRNGGARPGIATHDLRLGEAIRRTALEMGLPKDALEFQMLYGIQREQQLRLATDGWPMRVLISYGAAWYPWYMRRLAERPANLLFVARNLVGR